MGNRTSIKTDRDVFEELNAHRQERGDTWNEYLLDLKESAEGENIDTERVEMVADRVSERVSSDVREEIRSVTNL